MKSVARHAPTADRVILAMDDAARRDMEGDEGILVIGPGEIMDLEELQRMRRRYTPAEICFASKPRLLRAMLQAGYKKAHYLDSDMFVTASPSPIDAALEAAAILLVPHWTNAYEGEAGVEELDLLRAGTFNAGYVGVSADSEAVRFLNWWTQRCERWGYNDTSLGLCGDQRWLDPVPYLFNRVSTARRPQFNAGYWNLGGGTLEARGAEIFLNGEPLIVLHLSGFDPRRPDQLTRYFHRIDDSRLLILTQLLQQYTNEWNAVLPSIPPRRLFAGWRRVGKVATLPVRFARSLLRRWDIHAARRH